jgi:hypothetical protein
VVSEPPCLSLANCSRLPPISGAADNEDHDDDHNGGLAVALAYPQLVALHSVTRLLEQNPDLARQPAMKNKVSEVVQKGLASKIPEVAASAREVQRRLGR